MTAPVPAKAVRPPTAPSSLNTRVLGGLLLVFGAGWMFKETGVIDLPWAAVVSIVLIALGLALLVTARTRGRTVPLIILGGLLTAGLAIGSSDIRFRGGVGERVYTPAELTRPATYDLFAGDLTVDLTDTDLRAENRVRVNMTFGQLKVRVPKGVALQANVETRFGSARVFGDRQDVHGNGADRFETEGFDDAEEKLYLDLHVGFGQIEVVD